MLRTGAVLVFSAFVASGAWAQDKQLTPQQERMKACNAQAAKKELKGDERKGFMSRCLKSDKTAISQQDRMTSCNAQAKRKELKGDERQGFMRECLSGATPQAASGASARSKAR
jgi:hypothetical protein